MDIAQDAYTNYVYITKDQRARLTREEFDLCRATFDNAGGICSKEELKEALVELGQKCLPDEFEALIQKVGYRDGEFLRITTLVQMLEILKLEFWLDCNDPDLETVNAFVAVGGEPNKEGEVEQEGMFVIMEKYGLQVSETRKLAEEMDQNGDGTLDFDEFSALFTDAVTYQPPSEDEVEDGEDEDDEVVLMPFKKKVDTMAEAVKMLKGEVGSLGSSDLRHYKHGSAFKKRRKHADAARRARRKEAQKWNSWQRMAYTRLFPHTFRPQDNLHQLQMKMRSLEIAERAESPSIVLPMGSSLSMPGAATYPPTTKPRKAANSTPARSTIASSHGNSNFGTHTAAPVSPTRASPTRSNFVDSSFTRSLGGTSTEYPPINVASPQAKACTSPPRVWPPNKSTPGYARQFNTQQLRGALNVLLDENPVDEQFQRMHFTVPPPTHSHKKLHALHGSNSVPPKTKPPIYPAGKAAKADGTRPVAALALPPLA
eukprot:TRINITY_DN65987_c0_g1_i1.p1 TRINITY_DN65987_c0_g1~~TRINITY_DN65987_c0_g1_i1.p1  ORF type:complete len:486 (+),score=38.30 TRINITY_DN65987_c0_g1_i1:74-1531(+)